ncbi:MAG: DHH family phosphoesterase [Acidobacteriota bacterium]
MPSGNWVEAVDWREDASELAGNHSLSPDTAMFLAFLFPDAESRRPFLDETPLRFPAPNTFTALWDAADRLSSAVRSGESILVHGDYDVDGLMGTATLVGGLRALGGRVTSFVPSRFDGGYGLSNRSLDFVRKEGVSLVLTTDCGTNASEVGAAIIEAGIDLIVTDHHAPAPGCQPPGWIVNPHVERNGDEGELQTLCGASVAFMLLRATARHLGMSLPDEPFLRLCAIATVSDVVPMSILNRKICLAGFKALEETPNPGLAQLLSKCSFPMPVKSHHVTFFLAPRFNAAGRMQDAGLVLDLLLEKRADRASKMIGLLEKLNRERKVCQEAALVEAVGVVGGKESRVAFGASPNWHRGVLGPVAARVSERFEKSAFIVSVDGDEGTGSARSFGNDNVTQMLADAEGCLVRFGGHKAAAGFTVRSDRLQDLESALGSFPEVEGDRPSKRYVVLGREALDAAWVTLQSLDPLGPAAADPWIALEDVKPQGCRTVKGRHLIWEVSTREGESLNLIAWDGIERGLDEKALEGTKRVVGRLAPEAFRRARSPYYFQVEGVI